MPLAGLSMHDLTLGDKAILSSPSRELGYQRGGLVFLATNHLNNKYTHCNNTISVWLRPHSQNYKLEPPYCSDTYSNPQPLAATRSQRRLLAIGICVENSVTHRAVFLFFPSEGEICNRASTHIVRKRSYMSEYNV